MRVDIIVASRMEQQIQTELQYLVTQAMSLHGPRVDHDTQTLARHILASDPLLSNRPIYMNVCPSDLM